MTETIHMIRTQSGAGYEICEELLDKIEEMEQEQERDQNTTYSLQSAYSSVRSIPDLYKDMRLGKERRIRDLLRPIPNGKIICNMESTEKLLREQMYFDEYERDILRKWFDDIGRK